MLSTKWSNLLPILVRGNRPNNHYQKVLRKPPVCVNPLFRKAMDWHGLWRFRLRRWEKVNFERRLVATGHNLLKSALRT